MARRTKEDALATRASLLDAAERLFAVKGVSRTSLADIASTAGTTRGAIYWHFKDKGDLFNAFAEWLPMPGRDVERAILKQGQNPAGEIRCITHRPSAASRADDSATAPNTPPCILIMCNAAR